MRGNNTLILNDATMIEALQEYCDKRWKPADGPGLKIESVDKFTGTNVSGSWPSAGGFVVRTSERKDLPRDPIQHKI